MAENTITPIIKSGNQLARDLLRGVAAAAEYTGLSENAIRYMAQAGTIPVKRLGRSYWFRASALDAHFASCPPKPRKAKREPKLARQPEDGTTIPFRVMEAALAQLHNISDSRRAAFAGRVKNFNRLGFIGAASTGRSIEARYTLEQYLLYVFALELTQLGVLPEVIVAEMPHLWGDVRAKIAATTEAEPNWIKVVPTALTKLQEEPGRVLVLADISSGYGNRAMLFDLAAIVHASTGALSLITNVDAGCLRAEIVEALAT